MTAKPIANGVATTNGLYTNGHQQQHKETSEETSKKQESETKLNEIVTELNSHYQTYTEMRLKQEPAVKSLTSNGVSPSSAALELPMIKQQQQQMAKQIHVFITGLNTCPTYCHVCQQIIPLIAYASKCQLCSFTCHSTCSAAITAATAPSSSSSAAARKSTAAVAVKSASSSVAALALQQQSNDPLKYCNVSMMHSPLLSLEYSSYISKLISIGQQLQQQAATNEKSATAKSSNILLNDYVFLDTNSKWKKGIYIH